MLKTLSLLAPVTLVAAANFDDLDPADLARAHLAKPLAGSHVLGSNGKEIFSNMNRHLESQAVATKPCEEWDPVELNELARLLYSKRDARFAKIYDDKNDNRQFHFDALVDKEALWAREAELAVAHPETHGPGTENHEVMRDGKCAEMVMWWVHHLPAQTRQALTAAHGFTLPLLPQGGFHDTDNQEYIYQVSCRDCHYDGSSPSDASTASTPADDVPISHSHLHAVGPTPLREGPVDCPVDSKTGLPSVWYQPMNATGMRKKRCDWDYDPPCQPCEGIGGYIWGEQEDEIRYTSCEPIMKPEDIPKDNITSPVWPLQFTVKEVTVLINQEDTGGRFPGADPCATHNFANDTETFIYDGRAPMIRTDTTKSTIWTLASEDMFIKVSPFFCICVTPFQSNTTVPTGPLVHDFAKDAVLVGREKIGLEGLGKAVVADHWNKGPHHFWVEVETNLMVRGWQPYNGLNVYHDWDITAPDPKLFEVDKICYSGFLHKNVSCIAPYP